MVRLIVFCIGLAFMLASLVSGPFWTREAGWFRRSWVFDLGLFLAIAAHGWPDGVL